ncbi:MAG: 23S rRNA (uracil(1939)-C(5))-methyltransferase RlmD [Elusimicrobia bacterium]|nr:23S rRNA (uracil(1939)-C(5))-methyltransferase RlmD [Elusimicrobiota bacterium]MBD3411790.1 23S rRNA (uracil(1939)-C(5))-methyltransferase RlmD [Elusimicrobiota bacterium]
MPDLAISMNNHVQSFAKQDCQIHPCQHFGVCGGCSLRNHTYDQQCALKYQHVCDVFAGIEHPSIPSVIPSPVIEYYRNKMEYACGVWDGMCAIGLRERKAYYHVIDLKHCFLQSETANQILATVRTGAVRFNITGFHRKLHTGILRYVVIREGKNTGEILVNCITTPVDHKHLAPLFSLIRSAHPEITSFIWSTTAEKNDCAFGSKTSIIWGTGLIKEKINGLTFVIGPYSFFQTNTACVEKLYALLAQQCMSGNYSVVLDLFCGSGGIALSVADRAEKVIGIEHNPEAIQCACRNSQDNGITNCDFFHRDVNQLSWHELIQDWDQTCVILDPPRPGLGTKLKDMLMTKKPGYILYVSCNSRALMNDLQRMIQYYRITSIQPIDLFPHTPHYETVVALKKRRP